MSTVDDEIKAGIRRLITEKGRPVEFKEDWNGKPKVSIYGWTDYNAMAHIHPYTKGAKGCEWVVPEGIVVQEETYTQFVGTFASPPNEDEIGLNAPGCRCKCGKYKDVTLRVTCSLGEAIQTLIGYDTTKRMEL